MESTSKSYTCTVCNNLCLDNQECICCDNCDSWLHSHCTNLNTAQFNRLANSDLPFYCKHCRQILECSYCNSICDNGQNCILCNSCNNWKHLKCISLKLKSFRKLSNSNSDFNCDECYKSIFPFYIT